VNNGLSAAGIALGLIAAIAVCFWVIAVRPVFGAEPQWFHYGGHSCQVSKTAPVDGNNFASVGEKEIQFLVDLKDIRELQKFIPYLTKCEAWEKCLADRDEGKVKHCYANDRRWRIRKEDIQ